MACQDCALDLNRYNPACLRCGGRYLHAIQRQRMPQEKKRAWLRKALADWMAYGHAEQELRELVKSPQASESVKKNETRSASRR